MTTSGFPFWLPIVTAVVIFTGSVEFLMTSILLSAFSPLSAFVTALMVGARHIFYGITMLPRYRGLGWKKYYLIYSCCDETFSINYSTEIPEEIDHGWFYFWVSFLDQIYWVGGAALGGIFGSFITLDTRGLDFVMSHLPAAVGEGPVACGRVHRPWGLHPLPSRFRPRPLHRAVHAGDSAMSDYRAEETGACILGQCRKRAAGG